MKKFLTILVLFIGLGSTFAQNQDNYTGSSKFSDNWDFTFGTGIITGFNNPYSHVSPIIGIGVDKYITPVFGVGLDFKTAVAAPSGVLNPHTTFDSENLSLGVRANLTYLFFEDTRRKPFEVIARLDGGWGHTNCSHAIYPWVGLNDYNWESSKPNERNYATVRFGITPRLNLGKSKAWALGLDINCIWGGIRDWRLERKRGNIETFLTLTYHSKTSNGSHFFKDPLLYDEAEVAYLVAQVNDLKAKKEKEKIITQTKIVLQEKTFVVNFAKNSAEIKNPDEIYAIKGKKIRITTYSSPEGNVGYNQRLAERRAEAIKQFIEANNIAEVKEIKAEGAKSDTSNRIAIITVLE